jgi:voltage-gated potassium channel Kch
VVVATVAANLWWLIPTWKLKHHIVVEGSGRYLQTTLSYLVTDYFDVLQDAYESGAFGVRTAFRVVVIVAAVGGLWAWRKARDDRFLPFALCLGWLFGLAYLGGYSRWTCYLQPYRHIAPFTLLAVIPAAIFLAQAFRREKLRALWRTGAGALVILLALAVPRLGITALSWFHNHVVFKTRPAPGENVGAVRPHPMTGLKLVEPPRYRLQEFPEVWPIILAKVRQECRGRVLVREWMLAEWLSASEVPVLGGFTDRVVQQGVANLFARYPDGGMPAEELGPYLERYGVGCLLLSTPTPKLELRQDLFEPVIIAGERRLYRTRREPSYLAAGQGQVRQGLNQIAVDGAAGDEVVLKFHWMETLRCSPGCEIERVPVPGDPVGFIRVRHPPRSFVVHNSYRWP